MLKKLMKYDFREQGREQWPLQLAVVVGGLLAGICLAVIMTAAMTAPEVSQPTPMHTILIVLITLIMICIMASSIITQVLVAKQYYQNCFSDEGYLTFTLPVKTTDVLVSKLLTGGAWVMINLIAVLIGLALFLLVGFGATPYSAEIAEGFAELKAEFVRMGLEVNVPWICIKYFLLLLISSVAGVAMLQFVVTLGNQLAKKHKVLCAVAIYLLLSFVISIASSVLCNGFMLPLYLNPEPSAQQLASAFDTAMVGSLVLCTVCMGVLFFFTDRTIKTKLNLE